MTLIFSKIFSQAEEHPFIQFLKSKDLTNEDLITAEMLIERIEWEYDDSYWGKQEAYAEARNKKNYLCKIDLKRAKKAIPFLEKKDWLSFQVTSNERAITSVKALQFWPNLKSLVLINNKVKDISAISSLINLKYLNLSGNQVVEITALNSLINLEELILSGNPIRSYEAVGNWPKLKILSITSQKADKNFSFLMSNSSIKKLSISGDQLQNLAGLKELGGINELRVYFPDEDANPTGEFMLERLPVLPNLRSLIVNRAVIKNLNHLKAFPMLSNLELSFVVLTDIKGLSGGSNLRSLEIIDYSSTTHNLNILENLSELKSVYVRGKFSFDEKRLAKLDKLCSLVIKNSENGKYQLKNLKVSWDKEFLVSTRYKPSLKTKLVSQSEFEYYDINAYNYRELENNLFHDEEGEWLLERIQMKLKKIIGKEDLNYPYNYQEHRSQTVMITSDEGMAKYSDIILAIQEVLSISKNDWIIYLQQDGDGDPPIWVYPDHIEMTKETFKKVSPFLKKL